ncbi:MAG: hypothetical protein KC582_03125 [Candidatus Magasanikbacteria bacterium]|nr:hypothetical protein [Candidatus Magasanikbacteria bacterium]MCA9391221.1 hypothetical protein [Candidatus Magasanikbacteria bacterium]USN52471.1 MAG: hypothetical protein H6759_00050 [Candidatus Nomurabacteria bacterium]
MVIDFASRRDPAENRLSLLRRWFGSCESAHYLHSRVLRDEDGSNYLIVHVTLKSPLHQEVDFVGDDWKDLFIAKEIRFGFIMTDAAVIDCRPIWATKHPDYMELVCLVRDQTKTNGSATFIAPKMMFLADDKHATHQVPVVEDHSHE